MTANTCAGVERCARFERRWNISSFANYYRRWMAAMSMTRTKTKRSGGEGARYLLLHVFKTSCLSNECKYFMQSSIQSPCLIMQSRTIEPRLVHQIICYSNTQLNGLHHLFDKSSEHWKSSIKRRKALLKSSLKYPPTKNQLVFFPAFFSITTNGVRNHLHPHFVHQF